MIMGSDDSIDSLKDLEDLSDEEFSFKTGSTIKSEKLLVASELTSAEGTLEPYQVNRKKEQQDVILSTNQLQASSAQEAFELSQTGYNEDTLHVLESRLHTTTDRYNQPSPRSTSMFGSDQKILVDKAVQTLWTIPFHVTSDAGVTFNTRNELESTTPVPAFIETRLQADTEDLSDGEIPTFVTTTLLASTSESTTPDAHPKRKFAFEADNIDMLQRAAKPDPIYRPNLNDNAKYREKIDQLKKRLDSVDDKVFKARQAVEEKIQQRYYRTLLHSNPTDEHDRLKYSPKTRAIMEKRTSAAEKRNAIDTVSPSYILPVCNFAYLPTFILQV